MTGINRPPGVIRGGARAAQRRVLIVLEDADHTGAAVAHGVELARVEGAEVVFLQLPPEPGIAVGDAVAGMPMPGVYVAHFAQQRADRRAATALRAASQAGLKARAVRDDEAGGAAEIAAVASKERCDVIVIANAGGNAVLRLVNGSPIPGLITAAQVPVLVCRAEGVQGSGRIKRVRVGTAAERAWT